MQEVYSHSHHNFGLHAIRIKSITAGHEIWKHVKIHITTWATTTALGHLKTHKTNQTISVKCNWLIVTNNKQFFKHKCHICINCSQIANFVLKKENFSHSLFSITHSIMSKIVSWKKRLVDRATANIRWFCLALLFKQQISCNKVLKRPRNDKKCYCVHV